MLRFALLASLAASFTVASVPADAASNPIVSADRDLLTLVRTPGVQPATVHPTRAFAMLHVAQYDAVVAIDRRYAQYGTHLSASPHADRDAAAIVAGHDVLASLYPAQKAMLDASEQAALGRVRGGRDKRRGMAVGAAAAKAVLRLRAGDRADAVPPAYTTTGAPGDFAPSGPAAFTHWSGVKPWVMHRASQFRPGPPPALTSSAWTAALGEVRTLGVASGSTRTDDQTTQAKFWAAPIQNYWNEIAQTVVLARRASLDRSARTFAQLGLAVADSVIAFYDAKYEYRLWRPITALRLQDAGWTPLATTPADPSYPGAHSVVSEAARLVLESEFGKHASFEVTSEALPGVQRSFRSFAAAATEAGLSRLYAGVHTRLDHVAGLALGRDVARYVLAHALAPHHSGRGMYSGPRSR